MTIWIEKSGNEFEDDSMFAAWMGFRWRGQIIQFFSKPEKIHYKKNDVVVGNLQSVLKILNKLGINPPSMYIPEGLESFSGRTIEKTTVGRAIEQINETKIQAFIKPVATKEFPAQIVYPSSCLMTFPEQNIKMNMICWKSETVNFVSEYRLFMDHNKPIDCRIYLGDYRIPLDFSVIDNAINNLKNKITPAGWSLDWGVTDTGKTLLIEANDGFSLGHYGFNCIEYSQLLQRRWNELTESIQ